MINLDKTLYGASLFALAFSLSVADVSAQTCTTAPSCDTLGFTKSSADCEGHSVLKCPFDQSKLYCDSGATGGGSSTTTVTCPDGYFTYNDIYPSCNETGKTELIQHTEKKYASCYKCKKCSEGFWINPGSCGLGSSTDSAGCRACSRCTWSSDLLVNGRCVGS